jgi:hypothetical protein
MGKDCNRHTTKMNKKRAQKAKKIREKKKITDGKKNK